MKQNNHQYLLVPPENNQNWRLKSLNSGDLERYSVPISKTYQQSSKQKNSISPQSQSSQKVAPKITKINQSIFSILVNNCITIFSYLDQNQRERKKSRYKFIKKTINHIAMPNDIEWVCGDGSSNVYIGSQYQILVLTTEVNEQGIQVKEIWRKKIGNIKCFSIMHSNYRKILIILTQQSVFMYEINKNFLQLKQLPITFSSQSSGWDNINKINGICIIVESLSTFYFIGTSIQLKTDVKAKLGRDKDTKNEGVSKKCQALYLTKFQITKKDVQGRVFIIDHIFEIGIFKKSRGYQVGDETFLLSLHQQIIVIRRNFSKFMVWDNVSIISSKSNQKKGQLILAGKKIMLYTENGEISAHELYFNFNRAKIESPKIDNLRGNSSQQQLLYDGLILEFKKDSYMKVLFYFKQNEIYIPNRSNIIISQGSGNESIKNQLNMQLMCIQQTQPTQKLKQLLNNSKNKSIEQISQFLRRFHINDLIYKKSEWQVSLKGEKEIQQLLLNVRDNDYIQSQLTKILKQKPHDLQFLITIERKQIERYRNMLAAQLIKQQQTQMMNLSKKNKKDIKQNINIAFLTLSQLFKMRQIDQIKLSIQWLLESKMFERKLVYSLNFMTFKQYDFIQIGKLRAVSLREQIKLLGVKGYEKRLKYFFNSFKYLVLDDFPDILRFVIADLNQQQIRTFFIKNFPFILPSYTQNQQEDRCRLWQDSFKEDESKIETISLFKKQVQDEVKKIGEAYQFLLMPADKSIQIFNQIFEQFRKQEWFKLNSYKQHSLLRHSIEQLKQEFKQLKQVGVYNIIIQLMYQKIQNKKYNEKRVQEIIKEMKQQKYIPEDYLLNISARLEVYQYITYLLKFNRKQFIDVTLVGKSKFIILKENIYFEFLIRNFMKYLNQNIKDIYQNKKKGLFSMMFKNFLYSPQAKLSSLIDFIDCFRNAEQDELRAQVFKRICEMMELTDAQNSRNLISKLKQMPIMIRSSNKKQKVPLQKLIDEAKLALGVYFINLFIKLKIQHRYNELLQETREQKIQNTIIMKQIIEKYSENFSKNISEIVKFQKNELIDHPISDLELSEPVDFISALFYMHEMLGYEFKRIETLRILMFSLFERNKFEEVRAIMDQVAEFGRSFDDRQLIQNYPHYQLLNNFKHENNIKKQFQDLVLEWINLKYLQLAQLTKSIEKNQQNVDSISKIKDKIKQRFFCISSILKILNAFNYNEKVQRQISRISFLENIHRVSEDLLVQVLHSLIVEEQKYLNISGFVFMINLIKRMNKSLLNLDKRQKILEILGHLSNIHKQYEIVYHSTNKKNQEILLGEYCRFNAEFIVHLISCRYPWFSAFVLLDLINSSFYYRDVLFYFLARVIDTKKMDAKVIQKSIYEFLSIENVNDLKKILNSLIVKYELAEIVSDQCVVKNIKIIFTEILKNNQLDQAFFFIIRNMEVDPQEFEQIALSMNKFREDHILAQTLIVSFIRATKQKIVGQNSPTFMTFKTKLNCLMRPLQRMQVIKDIVILMSKLEIEQLQQELRILRQQNKQKNKKSLDRVQNDRIISSENTQEEMKKEFKNSLTILKDCYQKYMEAENLNPWLSIDAEQVEPTAVRIEQYPQYTVDERQSKQSYFKNLPIIRAEESEQVKQLRRKLFDNEKRLKQIQQGNRQLMEEQITAAITQVKINAEKEHLSLIDRKKKRKQQDQENQIKERAKQKAKQQELDEDLEYETQIKKVNEQEKDKISQMQKVYASKIVKQTENLIMQLRERRRKVKEQTTGTAVTDQDKKEQENKFKSFRNDRSMIIITEPKQENLKQSVAIGLKNSYFEDSKSSNNRLTPTNKQRNEDDGKKSMMLNNNIKFDFMKESHLRTTTINKLIGDKNGEYYVPRWESKVPKRLQQEQQPKEEKGKKSVVLLESIKKQLVEDSQKFEKLKKSIFVDKQKEKQKQKQKQKQKIKQKKQKKLSLVELIEKYTQLNQGNSLEILQKLSVLHNNPSAGSDIMKNIYLQMKQVRNFISLCQDLLTFNQNFSQFIEHKALKIVEDSMKIKLSIPYKEVFTANFYTSVHHVAMRDYYHIAYGIIKPNIIKVIQQISTQTTNSNSLNVNALATMIRFGFGSDPTFSYKVYEDYIKSLLQDYQNKSEYVFVQKDILLLAQKLRNIYGNLNPINKNIKFEQLIQQIKNTSKRKALIKNLLINLENKSTLVSKQSYEEFRLVLVKLGKDIQK